MHGLGDVKAPTALLEGVTVMLAGGDVGDPGGILGRGERLSPFHEALADRAGDVKGPTALFEGVTISLSRGNQAIMRYFGLRRRAWSAG